MIWREKRCSKRANVCRCIPADAKTTCVGRFCWTLLLTLVDCFFFLFFIHRALRRAIYPDLFSLFKLADKLNSTFGHLPLSQRMSNIYLTASPMIHQQLHTRRQTLCETHFESYSSSLTGGNRRLTPLHALASTKHSIAKHMH